MATAFAYVPSTSDGRTVKASEPLAIEIVVDASPDPWAWLRELELADDVERQEAEAPAGA